MKQLTLLEARTRRGWTQTQVADAAGIHKGTVSKLEAGVITRPSNDLVARIEKGLGLRRGKLKFGAHDRVAA